MKYTVVDTLNDVQAHVRVAGQDRLREIFRFPRDQKDVFDLMMQGKSMPEVEESCLEEARALSHDLDLLQLAGPESHLLKPLEYEIMKIPGGTGWQVEVLKPWLLPLSVFRRYHTLTPAEERILTGQLTEALREAKKARLELGRVTDRHIYLTGENQFVLDGFDKAGDRDDLSDLADLVCDPALREELQGKPLFG